MKAQQNVKLSVRVMRRLAVIDPQRKQPVTIDVKTQYLLIQ